MTLFILSFVCVVVGGLFVIFGSITICYLIGFNFSKGWYRGKQFGAEKMSECKKELICEKCGRDYPVWSAKNSVWNEVMRENGEDEFDFLCPTCFMVMAAMRGVTPVWKLDTNLK